MTRRLRLLGALVVVAMAVQVFAQDAPKLSPVATLIQTLSVGLGARWTQSAMKGEPLLSAQQAVADLEALLQQPAPRPQDVVQRDLIRKNLTAITPALSRIESKSLVYFRSIGPVYFADKDGQLTLLIGAIASGQVYDTLNTTAISRAQTVLRADILPVLRQLGPLQSIEGIKMCGVMAIYGSRNSVSRSDKDPHSETVTMVVPVESLRRLSAGDLTDAQVMAVADFYQQDREDPGVRRVKLALQ